MVIVSERGGSQEEVTAPYYADSGGLFWRKKDGSDAKLSNFTARITQQTAEDDGVSEAVSFEVELVINGRRILSTVPASRFNSLDWVTDAEAILTPGASIKHHTANAIRELSSPVERRTVYRHTGWKRVETPDGESRLVYLHNGGVGSVQVRLPDSLSRYCLPEAPAGEVEREAVSRSLWFLEIAPRETTLPVLAAVYAAPLGEVRANDFALWICGPTGTHKSTMLALALCHYGSFDRNHLPGNFQSTGNALEILAFHAKDALLVIDDFRPESNTRRAQAQEEAVLRLIAGVGDCHGRGRATASGGLRTCKPPRALIAITAELPPPGASSLEARMLVVDWKPGSVDLERLTQAQNEDAGYYALSMAGYLQWLTDRLDTLREQLASQERVIAGRLSNAGVKHPRIAENAAKLLSGLACFGEYAQECGVLSNDQRLGLLEDGYRILARLAVKTSQEQEAKRPAEQFLESLRAQFMQGRIYLVSIDGERPKDAERWGYPQGDRKPNAEKVGWIDEEQGLIYLLPAAVHRALNLYARDRDAFLPSQRALGQALAAEGILARRDKESNQYQVRVEGRRERCWVISAGEV